LILHPTSKGSAREWGNENFENLVRLLPKENFTLYLCGLESDRTKLAPLLEKCDGEFFIDCIGKFNLSTYINFIQAADGLIANSTGPLHIAALSNKDAFGIYPPIKPMHPGRWSPIGKHSQVFVLDKSCESCRHTQEACACMLAIQPMAVAEAIKQARQRKLNKL
jgi:ADP-heptose:LPS heptosyltransferase